MLYLVLTVNAIKIPMKKNSKFKVGDRVRI